MKYNSIEHDRLTIIAINFTLYAYLGRNVRSDYNESRFIALAMFTVCLVAILTFFFHILISDTSDPYWPEYTVAVFSTSQNICTLSVMFILYTPKVFIIFRINRKINKMSPHCLI